jgi:putative restriction endonuclease
LSDPDPQIGCIILSEPFYFEENDWIPVPENWSRNIVQGKTYDTAGYHGMLLYEQIRARLSGQRCELFAVKEESLADRYGKGQLVKPRIGQGAFKVLITDAYRRRCAITGERTLPVLEAAHMEMGGSITRIMGKNRLYCRSGEISCRILSTWSGTMRMCSWGDVDFSEQ